MSPKKTLASLLLALLTLSGKAAAQLGEAPAPRPGVYSLGLVSSSFRDQRYQRNELEEQMMAAATRAFLASRRFTIVEREKLKAIFNEKDLATILEGGDNDLSKIQGVDYLGLITYASEQQRSAAGGSQTIYWIEVQLTEVRSARVVATVSSRRDALTYATSVNIAGDRLLQNIREEFPPQGYIIQISPDRILVDLGEDVGIQKGDRLEVIREGERIIHPVTGKLLPAEEIIIGTLKVVEISGQMATCQAKDKDSGLQLADRVRLAKNDSKARGRMGKVLRRIGLGRSIDG